MSGHGPDAATFDKASSADTAQPHKVADTMAFMFETRNVLVPTAQALASPRLQADYQQCWAGIGKHFRPAP
jgi:homogentisate 1,2-dioxygenase